ncbi:endonuclease/exonuclease/phosphatase family protein [Sphingobacterium sp. lm-10]|uniref:endonuclease/exonuclease/phosphatase family protein n=1 Tax=Sphingobacterium sp. lm-10 TaxID=2944904 RepID=UPI002020B16C|nr:endonuclease/exonuclease/phosphatase family protein [Sphingobacterium sp. lm-10]MCL7986932.1 endonuclease/exonuclease/phosphatase family protein [Sphingobacterium sp. lm-10]
MYITLLVLSILLIVLSVLPFIQNQHWVFRVPEFMRLQLLFLQLIIFPITFFYVGNGLWIWVLQVAQAALIGFHLYIFIRYTKFWRSQRSKDVGGETSEKVQIIACNIYQYNTQYHRFIDLIKQEDPDVFVTMESNGPWEEAMRALEDAYPNYQKVTLENTYGMHLYTRLKMHRAETHYFVADDLPSIEAELETADGHRFILFAVHPPPPSPTEEKNSKERDGDLLCVAKKVRDYELPVVVVGDFNNVAWARASILFKKTSELIDARIGRGILATFHAKYWFFRVPLDLLFHCKAVFIDKLFIYPSIGSDHFPIGCTFHINLDSEVQQKEVKQLEGDDAEEVEERIEEGKKEESDNR